MTKQQRALAEIWDFFDEWDGPMTSQNAADNVQFFVDALAGLLAYLKEQGYAPLPPRAE